MAGPIILGMLSYTVMNFCDTWMVSFLGDRTVAAAGSAGLWSYTLSTLLLGVAGCVSTFASQCIGRNQPKRCGAYAWQGIYFVVPAAVLAAGLIVAAPSLFSTMTGHSDEVIALETVYFQVRALGYPAMVWSTALGAFFMSVNRPQVPMYLSILSNGVNLFLNYCLIFGKFGFPALGLAGAGIATILSQWLGALLGHALFITRHFDARYATRRTWRFNPRAFWEICRIGLPNGLSMFLDVFIWAIFTSFIVGRFGDTQLAAHNIAIAFMHVAFMPALGMNQAIAPIVGQWIGRGMHDRAQARTWTAIKLCMVYMFLVSGTFALTGNHLIAAIFSNTPEVVRLGHLLLMCAGVFQGFDAINIVIMGALRGAGDTRWMMWAMFVGSYVIFLPGALLVAIHWNTGAFGAWVWATVYILAFAALMYWRFQGGYWRSINIFGESPAHAGR